MSSPRIRNVSATCAACHAVNELVAAGLTDGQGVVCSQCGAPLGQWSELKLLAESDAGLARLHSAMAEEGSEIGGQE